MKKRKNNKSDSLFKDIFHYIFALFLATVFTLYCSARVGGFFLIMLVFAPVMDILMTFICSKYIEYEVSCNLDLLNKGNNLNMSIRVRNRSVLPTPPVEITFRENPGLQIGEQESNTPVQNGRLHVAVLPKSENTSIIKFCAKHGGGQQIGVDSVKVLDYLGFCSFTISTDSETQFNIGIIPSILPLEREEKFLLSISQAAMGTEDSEDTFEKPNANFGGFPGFEHRVYQPGDPVKRINWKLSVGKKDIYVRLDEIPHGAGIAVVLDSVMSDLPNQKSNENKEEHNQGKVKKNYSDHSDNERNSLLTQDTIEQSLLFARSFLLHDRGVSFYWFDGNRYQTHSLSAEEDLLGLARKLAYVNYNDLSEKQKEEPIDRPRLPQVFAAGKMKETAMLYCTPCADSGIVESLLELKQYNLSVSVYDTLTGKGVGL